MPLLQLPGEILLIATGSLDTCALANVSLSCKKLHTLVADQLRDKELRNFFGILDLSGRPDKRHRWLHPYQIIPCIKQEPEIAEYPRALFWSSRLWTEDAMVECFSQPPYQPRDKLNRSSTVVKKTDRSLNINQEQYLSRLQKARLATKADFNDQYTAEEVEIIVLSVEYHRAVAKLCKLLTNLEVIRIQSCFRASHVLSLLPSVFFDRPTQNERCPKDESNAVSHQGLRKVQTLILDAKDYDTGHLLSQIQRWLRFPSLRKFGSLFLRSHAHRIPGVTPVSYDDQEPAWDTDLYQSCNVEIVVMAQATITPRELAMCVKGMPKLKSLVYGDMSTSFSERSEWDRDGADDEWWTTTAVFIQEFKKAYGVQEWPARQLRISIRSNPFFQIYEQGYGIHNGWEEILDGMHCSVTDVERFLHCENGVGPTYKPY